MSRRTPLTAVSLLAALAVALFLTSCSAPSLVVEDQKTGTLHLEVPAAEVESIELAWIHSIEKTPWRERYIIEEEGFLLTDVFLKSYGAGAPADIGGTTTIDNGVIHISELSTEYSELAWVHSHDASHTLTVNFRNAPDPVVLSSEIPHRSFVRARVLYHSR